MPAYPKAVNALFQAGLRSSGKTRHKGKASTALTSRLEYDETFETYEEDSRRKTDRLPVVPKRPVGPVQPRQFIQKSSVTSSARTARGSVPLMT